MAQWGHKRGDLESMVNVFFSNCVLGLILILPTRRRTSQGQGLYLIINPLTYRPELNMKWVLNVCLSNDWNVNGKDTIKKNSNKI